MIIELRSCPFCKGKPDIWDSQYWQGYLVGCEKCKRFFHADTIEDAVAGWNRRKNDN